MERRLFVTKTTLLATGILALSGSNLYASNEEKNLNIIDLSPIIASKNKVILKGLILDSITFKKIDIQRIDVKIKRNRFFSVKQSIEKANGSYHIVSGFTNTGKTYEKMHVRITAEGYKPYEGTIYITKSGCHIHSEEWIYNPNFNTEYCPENNILDNQTVSRFNFHLVKI